MRRLTDTEKQALTILNNQTISTKDNIEFTSLVDVKDSHTTDSSYIILKDKSGLLYQLALSDHSSEVHDYVFDEIDEEAAVWKLRKLNRFCMMTSRLESYAPLIYTILGSSKQKDIH